MQASVNKWIVWKTSTTLQLFYVAQWLQLAPHVWHTGFQLPLENICGTEKKRECFNLRPSVLVAAQHINKRQVPAFWELGAQSLVRINSSLAGKGLGMF